MVIGLAVVVSWMTGGSALARPPEQLWLYYATNLQVKDAVEKLEPVWRRAAKAGYTHILLVDAKLARLGDLGGMERQYQGNVDKAKALARELNLELVPGLFHIGYSNNMLWHDPNLAEGLPVRDAKFVVKGNVAQLVADPPVDLSKASFIDDVIKVADGVATLRDPPANARMAYKVKVSPFRCYHVSVKVKTSDFRGDPRVNVLGGKGGASLQQQNLGAKPTQDWTEHHVVFNSLENDTATVYFGVWGGAKGQLAWKDWKIEEAGPVNVLRRPGTPVVVKGHTEGKDYEPIRDPQMGNKPYKGEYKVWHEAPAIKTKGIADGTELRISWYHPAIIYDGQVSCCPSEPRTMELLADEAKRVKAAFGTRGYMMSHDEVRTLNWDEACTKRNLDAGQILADNVKQCTKLLEGSAVYVWSDMFDPHHNAVTKDYYLVRGSLAGSWEGLDPSVVIMNWNYGKRDQSLKFFADRGHKQVIAGYYDHDVKQVDKWLESADKVQGVAGVMYTTWERVKAAKN
jgi:hypothetical protein